ncbi:MAG: BlaI/MecI/CopY family transcriptional regulator, partial [Thermocrispum sp.]
MRGFGELESAIMDVVWSRAEPATVREVLEALAGERDSAYTTVMTVMNILHRKGWLDRERAGRAWRYRPAMTREAYAAR